MPYCSREATMGGQVYVCHMEQYHEGTRHESEDGMCWWSPV